MESVAKVCLRSLKSQNINLVRKFSATSAKVRFKKQEKKRKITKNFIYFDRTTK